MGQELDLPRKDECFSFIVAHSFEQPRWDHKALHMEHLEPTYE